MTLTGKNYEEIQEKRRKRLQRITGSLIGLPVPPMTVTRLINTIDHPYTTARDLARIISSDQAVTAKILKLANSAFYGFTRKISTVNLAVVVLGFETVKNLVLSLSVIDSFSDRNRTGSFDQTRFWEHSMAVGVASRLIARRYMPLIRSEAFVAGLLHDIGKQILNKYFTKEFEEALRITRNTQRSLRDVEEEVLGADHAQVGGWLLENWNLPETLVSAVTYHHEPTASEQNTAFAATVYLANIIVKHNAIGFSGDYYVPEPDEDSLAQIRGGLTAQDINKLIEDIPGELESMEIFASIVREETLPEEMGHPE